jgi:hypothetical protein
MKRAVIGQTGRAVLSDTMIHRKLSKQRRIRYQFTKTKHGWNAWVCGPFHSRTYGVCGFGTKKPTAKAALQRRLANDYRYIGSILHSDVDEADTVGIAGQRLRGAGANDGPITF